jgi:hypothetical protein
MHIIEKFKQIQQWYLGNVDLNSSMILRRNDSVAGRAAQYSQNEVVI